MLQIDYHRTDVEQISSPWPFMAILQAFTSCEGPMYTWTKVPFQSQTLAPRQEYIGPGKPRPPWLQEIFLQMPFCSLVGKKVMVKTALNINSFLRVVATTRSCCHQDIQNLSTRSNLRPCMLSRRRHLPAVDGRRPVVEHIRSCHHAIPG